MAQDNELRFGTRVDLTGLNEGAAQLESGLEEAVERRDRAMLWKEGQFRGRMTHGFDRLSRMNFVKRPF